MGVLYEPAGQKTTSSGLLDFIPLKPQDSSFQARSLFLAFQGFLPVIQFCFAYAALTGPPLVQSIYAEGSRSRALSA